MFTADENGVFNQAADDTTVYSKAAYGDALAKVQAAFSTYKYFFENLMVAVALFMGFPNLSDRETLWKSYVSLCSLYSFYRLYRCWGAKRRQRKSGCSTILLWQAGPRCTTGTSSTAFKRSCSSMKAPHWRTWRFFCAGSRSVV